MPAPVKADAATTPVCKCVHCTCKNCCTHSGGSRLDSDSFHKRFYVRKNNGVQMMVAGAAVRNPFLPGEFVSVPHKDATLKSRQQLLNDVRKSMMTVCPFVKGVSMAPPASLLADDDENEGILVDVTFSSEYSGSLASSMQRSGYWLAEALPRDPPLTENFDDKSRKPLPPVPRPETPMSTVSSVATVYYSFSRMPLISTTSDSNDEESNAAILSSREQGSFGDRTRTNDNRARHARFATTPTTVTTLILDGLNCSHCAHILKTALGNRNGVIGEVKAMQGPPQTVVVTHDDSLSPKRVREIIEDFGFGIVDSETHPLFSNEICTNSVPHIQSITSPKLRQLTKTTMDLHGLTCAACVASVTNILSAKEGVISPVSVTLLPRQRAVITHDSSKTDADALKEAVEDAGFEILDVLSVPLKSGSSPQAISPPVQLADGLGGTHGTTIIDVRTAENGADDQQRRQRHSTWLELDHGDEDDPNNDDDGEGPDSNVTVSKLLITGMTCAGCVAKLESGLLSLLGVKEASVSLITRRATIRHDQTTVGVRDLITEIAALGFSAEVDMSSSREAKHREVQRRDMMSLTIQASLGLLFALPTLIISMVIMMALPRDNPARVFFDIPVVNGLSRGTLAVGIMATLVQFGLGWRFYVASYKSLRFTKSANMDVLIALGTSAAYFYSLVTVIIAMASPKHDDGDMMSSDDQFFETSVLLIFFVLLGRLLESYAKRRTTDSVESLLKLAPRSVTLVSCTPDAREVGGIRVAGERSIGIELVQIGDILKVIVGARFPCDGFIIRGNTSVDESLLTGESMPVQKSPGDAVVGGSTNNQAVVLMKVTKSGSNTFLARIGALVEDAQSIKAPIQSLSDSLSRFFVPAILLISLLTLILWVSLGPLVVPGLHGEALATMALRFAIAVLVVACPCALGLAVPTAVMVGSGIAARAGVLVSGGGAALQSGESCRIVAFDKTGTLTEGKARVANSFVGLTGESAGMDPVAGKSLWRSVHALAVSSAHPLSKAVALFAAEEDGKQEGPGGGGFPATSSVWEVPGMGIGGLMDLDTDFARATDSAVIRFTLFIGSAGWMRDNGIVVSEKQGKAAGSYEDLGNSVVYVGISAEHSATRRDGGGNVAAVLGISDIIRSTSRDTVRQLTAKKIDVHMLTGDSRRTALAVAMDLGIPTTNVWAALKPADKATKLLALKSSLSNSVDQFDDAMNGSRSRWHRLLCMRPSQRVAGGTILFVGDGINDAVALAASDVGIAIGAGSEVAVDSAGVVLTRSNPEDVITFLNLSGLTMRRVRWNLAWALVYNVLFIPVAAGLFYPATHLVLQPWMAGFLMAMSSVSVVCSSLLMNI